MPVAKLKLKYNSACYSVLSCFPTGITNVHGEISKFQNEMKK